MSHHSTSQPPSLWRDGAPAKCMNKRTRACFACNHCRARKVRCDGVRLGLPCTNCRIDKFHCALIDGKKKKVNTYQFAAQLQANRHHSSLPLYIRPLPSRHGEADFQYLRLRGLPNLPDSECCRKLWDSYFELVHPSLPILDRDQVLRSLSPGSDQQGISLLLFYCVMLAVKAFGDAHENTQITSSSPQTLFETVLLLFDLDWETDQFALLQSTLLLSYYPQSYPKARRGPSYWISQAVSLAYALGLHRNPAEVSSCPREHSLRKRLWWSVYIRERLLALDYGAPSKIWDDTQSVPMLSVEDFEPSPLWDSQRDCGPFAPHDSAQQQRQLALVFIERAKMARIIGRLPPIAVGACDYEGQQSGCTSPRVPIKAPAPVHLSQIGRELSLWLSQIPLEILCAQIKVYGRKGSVRDMIVDANHSMLFLLYYIISNHIASVSWLGDDLPSRDAPEDTIDALRASARSIINLVDSLLDGEQLAYFQLVGPSLIRPLLLCKILDKQHPPWIYLTWEIDRIPLLIEKIGKTDHFYVYALSVLQFVDENPSSSSDSGACETEESDTRMCASSPVLSDFVGAILSDFASDSCSLSDISNFGEIFDLWEGPSPPTTAIESQSYNVW